MHLSARRSTDDPADESDCPRDGRSDPARRRYRQGLGALQFLARKTDIRVVRPQGERIPIGTGLGMTETAPPTDLLNTEEACDYVGVSKTTLLAMVRKHRSPAG